MLVLTRKAGEAIVIEGGFRIVVISIEGRGVRIGIEAPASASILREELVREVMEENRRAGSTEVAPEWIANLAPLAGGRPPAAPG